MGSAKKSKDKKKRRDSISPFASEGERKSRKRHRSEEEEGGRKSKKREKKEKRKESESHRHRSDKEKKSKDRHKRKRHEGDHQKKLEFQEISKDDYFSKNNEFATWLKEEKKMFFSDLSSEIAHGLFSEFVEDWNDQRLDSKFYEGISSGPRTAHNWKIKQ
ncbi:hypothetical protein HS088_TW23G00712 [Tripterygium wilfordii]|uniref:Uncharacterized protein n=2 Tax=Tripterygium wilfordii TaxID=458696 RepID=A0A7J7BWB3_TRIWF|nr:style cell-cycle inhibitor 1-A isoform X2 [Tripterygium wilfordii]KAF5725975.1 hypothetical protein HS088_TW23G00712 [Tripterygium wilfordii]